MKKPDPVKRLFFDPYYEVVVAPPKVTVYSHFKGRTKELSQGLSPTGYLRVKMNNKHKLIHHLVTEAYLGPRPKDLVVNHIDGNRTNNHPENLEYVTQYENVHNSIDRGTHVCIDPTGMPTYIDGRCKDKNKYKREWYLQNKERILKMRKKHYQNNKEKIKLRCSIYYYDQKNNRGSENGR